MRKANEKRGTEIKYSRRPRSAQRLPRCPSRSGTGSARPFNLFHAKLSRAQARGKERKSRSICASFLVVFCRACESSPSEGEVAAGGERKRKELRNLHVNSFRKIRCIEQDVLPRSAPESGHACGAEHAHAHSEKAPHEGGRRKISFPLFFRLQPELHTLVTTVTKRSARIADPAHLTRDASWHYQVPLCGRIRNLDKFPARVFHRIDSARTEAKPVSSRRRSEIDLKQKSNVDPCEWSRRSAEIAAFSNRSSVPAASNRDRFCTTVNVCPTLSRRQLSFVCRCDGSLLEWATACFLVCNSADSIFVLPGVSQRRTDKYAAIIGSENDDGRIGSNASIRTLRRGADSIALHARAVVAKMENDGGEGILYFQPLFSATSPPFGLNVVL